jgi:hypothetical protein
MPSLQLSIDRQPWLQRGYRNAEEKLPGWVDTPSPHGSSGLKWKVERVAGIAGRWVNTGVERADINGVGVTSRLVGNPGSGSLP